MGKIIRLCIVVIMMIGCGERESWNKKHISRYGSLIKVKKEYEERYIILHRNTFPGVLERIYKCNIRNYSIFLNQGILFSHFEYVGNDFQADMAKMADPVTKDWWKLTDPMQEPLQDRKKGEWWASMELLYQLDSSKVSYTNAQRKAYIGNLIGNQLKILKSKLNKIDDEMVQEILNYNIQNLTIYNHANRIYLYFEYVGKDYQTDLNQFLKMKYVKNIYEFQETWMKPQSGSGHFWAEMQEIFHTN
jgi:L-rhamnose mutarotase